MRLCFDATDEGREISGIFTPECFVCGRDLQALSNWARDQHIEQCVSAPVIVEEFDGAFRVKRRGLIDGSLTRYVCLQFSIARRRRGQRTMRGTLSRWPTLSCSLSHAFRLPPSSHLSVLDVLRRL